jgi:hypothetical protein
MRSASRKRRGTKCPHCCNGLIAIRAFGARLRGKVAAEAGSTRHKPDHKIVPRLTAQARRRYDVERPMAAMRYPRVAHDWKVHSKVFMTTNLALWVLANQKITDKHGVF